MSVESNFEDIRYIYLPVKSSMITKSKVIQGVYVNPSLRANTQKTSNSLVTTRMTASALYSNQISYLPVSSANVNTILVSNIALNYKVIS